MYVCVCACACLLRMNVRMRAQYMLMDLCTYAHGLMPSMCVHKVPYLHV